MPNVTAAKPSVLSANAANASVEQEKPQPDAVSAAVQVDQDASTAGPPVTGYFAATTVEHAAPGRRTPKQPNPIPESKYRNPMNSFRVKKELQKTT